MDELGMDNLNSDRLLSSPEINIAGRFVFLRESATISPTQFGIGRMLVQNPAERGRRNCENAIPNATAAIEDLAGGHGSGNLNGGPDEWIYSGAFVR
jgi:hypothetical protein